MAEYIDVLTTGIDGGGEFTIDIAQDFVPLTPVALSPHNMYADSGMSIFVDGDNFIILSVGYILPYQFVLAPYDETEAAFQMVVPEMQLNLQDSVTLNTALCLQFGSIGRMRIPFSDYELSCGIFIDVRNQVAPNPIVNPYRIQCTFPHLPGADTPNVSMINVPESLDGQTLRVPAFIKILHNKPIFA